MTRSARPSPSRRPPPQPGDRDLHPAILRLIVAMAEADEAEDWAQREAQPAQDKVAAA